jgi:hypothetical protein
MAGLSIATREARRAGLGKFSDAGTDDANHALRRPALLTLVEIVGPLLLGLAILYGIAGVAAVPNGSTPTGRPGNCTKKKRHARWIDL